MKIFETNSYREFLRNCLKQKLAINPNYSQRAFARFLDITPSRISEILNDKGHLNPNNAERVATILFNSKIEIEYFLLLRECELSKDENQSKNLRKRLTQIKIDQNYKQIDLDASAANQWFHYAILFILQINGQASSQAIGHCLSLPEETISEAICQLIHCGLLNSGTWHMDPEMKYIKTPQHSLANRSFNKSIILKSLDAMNRFPINERFFTSFLFTMNKSQFTQLTKIINDFSHSIADQGSAKHHDSVYCFSNQLFPISSNISSLF